MSAENKKEKKPKSLHEAKTKALREADRLLYFGCARIDGKNESIKIVSPCLLKVGLKNEESHWKHWAI